MAFLAAPMLFGLALASLPVLIHLLNRRRFQVVDWAPMKYLKLTLRTNRRRIQIEQLLLLLLRTLLIVILVLAVARPVLSKTGLGGWLARRNRTSRVIVIDTAMNAGYRVGGRTALDRAKDAAAEILANTGSQDAVTVLTSAPGAVPLAREAGPEASGRLAGLVRDLRPTDAACDWAATFKAVDDLLGTATFPDKQLILITDLRRSGWRGGPAITQLADHWAATKVEARVVDCGSRDTADVALVKLAQDDPLALPDAPVRLSATVRNGTAAAIGNATATLTVDGDRRPVLLPPLPAGATTDVPLSVTLDHAGPHAVSLALGDDALAGDNARFLCVDARDRLDLTIVDGRVGAEPFESSGDFLQVAVTAAPSAWQVKRVGADEPAAAHLPAAADLTVLADVAALPPATVAGLAEQVRAGMGLIVFAGEGVDPTFYNDVLYRAGLLPCKVDRAVDGPVRGLVVEPLADSPASALTKLAPAALTRVQARRLLVVDPPAKSDDTARVLARWNDAEGHPALIERRLGRGRVMLVTTSADREWSDWPTDPTYVLLVRAAAAALAKPDAGDANAVAGHPVEYRPGGDATPVNPRFTTPDEPTARPAAVVDRAIRFAGANAAGVYTLAWTDAAGAKRTHPVAVSYDPAAADLEPIDGGALARLLGTLNATVVRFVPGQLAANGVGRELWRTLAATMLALFVVETAFAAWVGRGR